MQEAPALPHQPRGVALDRGAGADRPRNGSGSVSRNSYRSGYADAAQHPRARRGRRGASRRSSVASLHAPAGLLAAGSVAATAKGAAAAPSARIGLEKPRSLSPPPGLGLHAEEGTATDRARRRSRAEQLGIASGRDEDALADLLRTQRSPQHGQASTTHRSGRGGESRLRRRASLVAASLVPASAGHDVDRVVGALVEEDRNDFATALLAGAVGSRAAPVDAAVAGLESDSDSGDDDSYLPPPPGMHRDDPPSAPNEDAPKEPGADATEAAAALPWSAVAAALGQCAVPATTSSPSLLTCLQAAAAASPTAGSGPSLAAARVALLRLSTPQRRPPSPARRRVESRCRADARRWVAALAGPGGHAPSQAGSGARRSSPQRDAERWRALARAAAETRLARQAAAAASALPRRAHTAVREPGLPPENGPTAEDPSTGSSQALEQEQDEEDRMRLRRHFGREGPPSDSGPSEGGDHAQELARASAAVAAVVPATRHAHAVARDLAVRARQQAVEARERPRLREAAREQVRAEAGRAAAPSLGVATRAGPSMFWAQRARTSVPSPGSARGEDQSAVPASACRLETSTLSADPSTTTEQGRRPRMALADGAAAVRVGDHVLLSGGAAASGPSLLALHMPSLTWQPTRLRFRGSLRACRAPGVVVQGAIPGVGGKGPVAGVGVGPAAAGAVGSGSADLGHARLALCRYGHTATRVTLGAGGGVRRGALLVGGVRDLSGVAGSEGIPPTLTRDLVLLLPSHTDHHHQQHQQQDPTDDASPAPPLAVDVHLHLASASQPRGGGQGDLEGMRPRCHHAAAAVDACGGVLVHGGFGAAGDGLASLSDWFLLQPTVPDQGRELAVGVDRVAQAPSAFERGLARAGHALTCISLAHELWRLPWWPGAAAEGAGEGGGGVEDGGTAVGLVLAHGGCSRAPAALHASTSSYALMQYDAGTDQRWRIVPLGLEVQGAPPPARAFHAAQRVGTEWIVHGGTDAGMLPGAAEVADAAAAGANAGARTPHSFADVHVLDITTLCWSRAAQGGAGLARGADPSPPWAVLPRAGHASAAFRGQIIVFGGYVSAAQVEGAGPGVSRILLDDVQLLETQRIGE